jgi:Alcohol dehydrogenase GroES-associated
VKAVLYDGLRDVSVEEVPEPTIMKRVASTRALCSPTTFPSLTPRVALR